MDVLAILIVQALVFGAFCAYVAAHKNRNGGTWFGLGLLFSLPALIALIAAPKLEHDEAASETTKGTSLDSAGDRSCPFCAEKIKLAAKVCRYCQRDLPAAERAIGDSASSPPPLAKEAVSWTFWVDKDAQFCISALGRMGCTVELAGVNKWHIGSSDATVSTAGSLSDLRTISAREFRNSFQAKGTF